MDEEFSIGSRVQHSPAYKVQFCLRRDRIGTIKSIRGDILRVKFDGRKTLDTLHKKWLTKALPRSDLTAALESLLGPL